MQVYTGALHSGRGRVSQCGGLWWQEAEQQGRTLEAAASRAQSRLEEESWVPMECREPLDRGPIISTTSSSSVTIFSATTYSPAPCTVLCYQINGIVLTTSLKPRILLVNTPSHAQPCRRLPGHPLVHEASEVHPSQA